MLASIEGFVTVHVTPGFAVCIHIEDALGHHVYEITHSEAEDLSATLGAAAGNAKFLERKGARGAR